jgi:hypothetical protein
MCSTAISTPVDDGGDSDDDNNDNGELDFIKTVKNITMEEDHIPTPTSTTGSQDFKYVQQLSIIY